MKRLVARPPFCVQGWKVSPAILHCVGRLRQQDSLGRWESMAYSLHTHTERGTVFRITEACSHLGPECGIGIGRKASRSPETQAAGQVRGDILPPEYE